MSQRRSTPADARPLPLAAGVAVSLAGIGAMSATALFAGPYLMAGLGFRGFLILCEAALVLPATLALDLFRPAAWRSNLGLANPGRPTLLLCAGLGATLWVASLGLLELQYTVWPPDPGYIEGFRQVHAMLRPSGPLDALYSVVAIALVPALCEEAAIRGVLLPSLRTQLGVLLSIGLSSLMFAFMHDAYRMPFTFAVGLALGALRLRTGSLLPSLLAHAALNTLTFAAAPFLDDPTGPLPDPRPLLGLLLLVAGSLASAFLWTRLPGPS
ncbi:MAG TPA: type II CAAX endopeptidase family protein, partial [Vicinamibacteria bacterium]